MFTNWLYKKRLSSHCQGHLLLSQTQKEAKAKIEKLFADEKNLGLRENCDVCGDSKRIPFARRDSFGLPCPVSICQTCGLVYQEKTLNERALQSHYDNYSMQILKSLP